MSEHGPTETEIKQLMKSDGLSRNNAVAALRKKEAGELSEDAIREKVNAGLTRAQAIEALKNQRANDANNA